MDANVFDRRDARAIERSNFKSTVYSVENPVVRFYLITAFDTFKNGFPKLIGDRIFDIKHANIEQADTTQKSLGRSE